MKTILFILPDLNMGGAERIITTIINSIDKSFFKPKLLLLRKEGYYLELLDKEIEIIDIKTPRIRNAIFPILNVIRKHKPEIVFSGWGEVAAFLSPFIPFFPKTKFIVRETNIVSQHVTRPEIKFFYNFYNNYKTIIAQSEDMKEDLVENINIKENKIIKINNPVDLDLINAKQNENIDLPFNKNSKNVLAIGNLSHRKGFDNLLKVFFHLKEEDIHLYILGDGADKEKLLNQKKELGLEKVHFLGKVTNPFPYLKNADLFILSSRYEGFPNVLLEAGACGTFSLSNNCKGGINEIIVPDKNGKILNIENYSDFAMNVKKALMNKHNSEIIKDSIKQRFAKEVIIREYEKVFHSI